MAQRLEIISRLKKADAQSATQFKSAISLFKYLIVFSTVCF